MLLTPHGQQQQEAVLACTHSVCNWFSHNLQTCVPASDKYGRLLFADTLGTARQQTSATAVIRFKSPAVMAAQGAALQNHNNELVKCIEDLREKREGVMKQIADEELEKAKIQTELQALTKRLAAINESLARKIDTRNEYDKVIAETESAYLKILESSQTLLSVLKRESVNIQKRRQAAA